MILIASYGLSRFISNEPNLKAKIIFVSIFIISHAITILAFSDLIYYSPEFIWPTPLPFSLQASLELPIVSILGIIFLITFGIFAIRKLIIFKKTTQQSS
jgi:flagellar biogenesis protein FliO